MEWGFLTKKLKLGEIDALKSYTGAGGAETPPCVLTLK